MTWSCHEKENSKTGLDRRRIASCHYELYMYKNGLEQDLILVDDADIERPLRSTKIIPLNLELFHDKYD